jgi:hypothetical protein
MSEPEANVVTNHGRDKSDWNDKSQAKDPVTRRTGQKPRSQDCGLPGNRNAGIFKHDAAEQYRIPVMG